MTTGTAPTLSTVVRRSSQRPAAPEPRPDVRLSDAAVEFDRLLAAAHHAGLVERPEIRRTLGSVVDAIATSIQQRSGTSSAARRNPLGDDEPVGPVLLDRAASRFSTRVIGTEIGRRACPPSVLTALEHARRMLVTPPTPPMG